MLNGMSGEGGGCAATGRQAEVSGLVPLRSGAAVALAAIVCASHSFA